MSIGQAERQVSGKLNSRLFTTLVLIALATTALTGPLLRLKSRTAGAVPAPGEG